MGKISKKSHSSKAEKDVQENNDTDPEAETSDSESHARRPKRSGGCTPVAVAGVRG